jgi:hypothetical protein
MEPRITFILAMLALYVIVTVALIVVTARSPLTKDRKIVVYILSILVPVIGLVAYLIFRFSNKNETFK